MKGLKINWIRIAAIGAPVLILLYGLLRLIDVMNHNQGHGFNWNLGHAFFLTAFVLLGVLIAELRRLVPAKTKPVKAGASILMTAGLTGAACFFWGILGDLFSNVAPLPGILKIAGPLLFQAGMLGLLIMLSVMRPHRLPVWSPAFVLIGFLLFAINLNLIPLGALVILLGLSPLVNLS